ncbi:MAG: flagellin [Pseudomonadales bacterium]|nr:flagellin [Pseudomonadales bacterium]
MANNSINTNLSSLIGINLLNKNKQAINSAFEKVASGSRINSAKDDAAGLAIANRFQTQIGGLNTAVRNANDGISFAQTAESALGEVTTNLQRMRELSIQAANGTNSASDRSSIQKEIDQLSSEINRIAETTTFNGKNVLSGALGELNFQIGANSGDSVSISGINADINSLGSLPGTVQSRSDRVRLEDSQQGTQGIQEGDADVASINDFEITVAGESPVNIADEAFGGDIDTVNSTSDLKDRDNESFGSGTAKSIAERINNIREQGNEDFANVYASARTEFSGSDLVSDDYSGTVDSSNAPETNVAEGQLENGDLTINGVDIGPVNFEENDASGSLAEAINARSSETGVSASVNDNGELSLVAEDGRDIVVDTASSDITNTLFGGGDERFSANFNDLRISGQVTVSGDDSLSFSGASNELTGFDDLSVEGAQDNVAAQGTVSNADVSTPEAANNTIQSIDNALQQIDEARAGLGAIQNRFESTIRNLSNVQESQEAARSRIADTDFAKQLSELTKDLVRQQAGIAVQSQANAQAQQIITLLG